MTKLVKTLIPILFAISCASSVEKPAEKQAAKEIEKVSPQLKPEPALETKVIAPRVPEKNDGFNITGTWQQVQQNGTLYSSGLKFKFYTNGEARLIKGDIESKFEKYGLFNEKVPGKLSLFPAKGDPRHWLFRTVDSDRFEVAERETCPANKSCYSPSFDRLVPLRFKRISNASICAD